METLSHDFTHAALLVAECLADYYQTGELIVFDYVGENCDPVEHHIKNFIVTKTDLRPLLTELESVQNPEHWKYQGWASEEILQQWLRHIWSVHQTLKNIRNRKPIKAAPQLTKNQLWGGFFAFLDKSTMQWERQRLGD